MEERTLAQEALWRWFLEWSRIARSAIADRRSLRRLGFLHSGRGVADAADEPATPPPGLPAPE